MAIIIEEKPSLTLGLFINGAICKCDKVIKRQLNYMDMGYKVTQKQHPVKSDPRLNHLEDLSFVCSHCNAFIWDLISFGRNDTEVIPWI